jgi:hypothetical protein
VPSIQMYSALKVMCVLDLVRLKESFGGVRCRVVAHM